MGLACCRDNNIGCLNLCFEISRLRMGHDHCATLIKQKRSHGLANNIGAANNNRMLSNQRVDTIMQ